jgi:purine-nucleoside phosphorylase
MTVSSVRMYIKYKCTYFITGAKSTTEERSKSFTNMMKLALETAVK